MNSIRGHDGGFRRRFSFFETVAWPISIPS
jgi:hypothetical protein